ncbi:MAG: PorT family protein [Flavobacteriaceae bacterium]|nr:PorT family protein [Flavobacteriaceae bacterium]
MKYLLLLVLLSFGFQTISFAQDNEAMEESLDTKYREDQFYFGVSYNLLRKMPSDMAQNGFSSGFHLGFIRDMPVNTSRTVAFGIGLGYSGNAINQNLYISKDSQNNLNYTVVESGSFSKNKITMHLVELPFEFRWRSSTAESYKFFRIYPGFKIGYLFASSIKYKGDLGEFKLRNIDDFNDFQYGFTLSAGYDKFNAHIYYALNSIFKDQAKLNSQTLQTSIIKIGLMLYIL